jgi:hypothetical protein
MIGLIGFVLAIVFLILLFLGGLAFFRWRFGQQAQQMYMAIGGLVVALILDVFWLITAIQWCTGGVKQSLRLSGSASGNKLLDDLIGRFGGVSPDSASSFGLILPLAAAALAHVAAVLVVAGIQHLFMAAQAQQRPSRRQPAANLLRWQAGGYLAASIPVSLMFYFFCSIDANLMRYRMVLTSPPLRKALGEDWASLGWAELSARAHNTMQGMIFLHLPIFYIGFTLLTAIAAVFTIHLFLQALNTLRQEAPQRYQVMPLVLAPVGPNDRNYPGLFDPPQGPVETPPPPPEESPLLEEQPPLEEQPNDNHQLAELPVIRIPVEE